MLLNPFAENKMTDWLHALITCVSEKNINIQTVAMGTLLDLINVSLCVFPPCDRNQPMENSANVMPLISHADFVILDQSQIYKVIYHVQNILILQFFNSSCSRLPKTKRDGQDCWYFSSI